MTRTTWALTGYATLLWSAMALATPTPQQQCDYARITAWKTYVSCVESVVARDAKGVRFDEFAAFAKCRHTFFQKWIGFQAKASLATSTCQPVGGARFVDNGDQTVTDNLSGLVWERKDNLDGTPNDTDPHDADNTYTWSRTVLSDNEDGNAFTDFLATINVGFAGANGWRLPTIAELQTIERDFACTGAGNSATCTCGSSPCIDATFGSTQSTLYWSATANASIPGEAWCVYFYNGYVSHVTKNNSDYVRAVRGGF